MTINILIHLHINNQINISSNVWLLVATEAFHNLFVHDTPFLDVRSEDEFAKGSLPNSFNFPILNNYERH